MSITASSRPGTFCWLDLAASDAARAQRFYAQAFGWTFRDEHVLGGVFTRCRLDGGDVEDAVGALLGLWQAVAPAPQAPQPEVSR